MEMEEIKKYTDVIAGCPLFYGIEGDSLYQMLDCLGAESKLYQKGEFIFWEGDPVSRVGVVLEGRAQIIREDYLGNRTIVAAVSAGELFAETFACARVEAMPVSVLAMEKTKVLLLDYARVVNTCSASCSFHSRLIANMLRVIANKNLAMNAKLETLSKRSTREKVLSFLSAQAVREGKREFEIPFNRQELADYLCVDRSALSAEIGKLKKDGVLEYTKNSFVLL